MLDLKFCNNSELTRSGCILLVASAPARPPVFSTARHGPVAGDENGWCDLLAGRRCLTAACGLGGRATWPGNRSLIRVAARVRPGSSGYLSCAPGSSSTPSTPRSVDTLYHAVEGFTPLCLNCTAQLVLLRPPAMLLSLLEVGLGLLSVFYHIILRLVRFILPDSVQTKNIAGQVCNALNT